MRERLHTRKGDGLHEGPPGGRRAAARGRCYTSCMNEAFGEMKARYRKLNELLSEEGSAGNLDFARAVSQAHRLLRVADRTRQPSDALRGSIEKAELLGRAIR